MKKCSKCNELKDISEFHRHKQSKDGLKSWCKVCRNATNKKHRESNPEYYKKWRNENRSYVKKYNDKYYSTNKDKINKERVSRANKYREATKAYKKSWYRANQERLLREKKKRYEANKDAIIKREMAYRENSPNAKLRHTLRARLSRAIKYSFKAGSAVRDLGCSIDFLKSYLETLFKPGMSWDNYGEWHIDHIVPLVSFDLTDRDQVKQACHYTNLQPLWAEENLRKGAKSPVIKEI